MRSHWCAHPACSLVLLIISPSASLGADIAWSEKAQAVLKTHCQRCHGQDGKAKGGFNYVLDRQRLVANDKVIPGRPGESEIYQRIVKGEMPPADQKLRPTQDDVAVLRQWIEAGAPARQSAAGQRPSLAPTDVSCLILADLQAIAPRHRRYARYFTLAHLANAGAADDELQTVRQALSKLINSLSWHPRIAKPQAIDSGGVILRIDLRNYQWNAQTWDRLAKAHPYRLAGGSREEQAIVAATRGEVAHVQADWFIATASRPPLYYDLLQLPSTDRELERQLRVDVATNIREETALRAGFNGSGVSKNNRLIERHDAAYGAYWKTYDFSDNLDRQNLFEHPLGPAPGQNSFIHAGGEIIFNLPNGLQGYLLINGNGRRVDRAPVEIVSDPQRPDRTVEPGLSCMACHVRGVIPKADQVRPHVLKNPNTFSRADAETITALYPSEGKLRKRFEEDAERFAQALAKAGASARDREPVAAVALQYEAPLDRTRAAAEPGLSSQEFAARLQRSVSLSRLLGPLNTKGGTVQRQAFEAAFSGLAREFGLAGNPISLTPVDNGGAASPGPFTGHSGPVLCVAFSADGRRALSGSADKTLRLWDVETGKELRRCEGHTDAVLTVAFSPDGQRALSGGGDRTVCLWDLASGRQLARWQAHTDKVRCVAFSPDGRHALSGGDDRTVRWWDVETGKELQCLIGHRGAVHCVTFAPEGRRVLSGGADHVVRLWDLAGARELRRFEGHDREVFTVAFAPDGRRAASGGDDRVVRLWQIESGRELRRFAGHANAVIRVAFAPDGRHLLSGSSRYQTPDRVIRVWEIDSGKELHRFGAGEESVGCIAFSPDGRFALSGGSERSLRLQKLSK